MADKESGSIYYYTNLSSITGILPKGKNKVVLCATNCQCLNDFTELEEGLKMALDPVRWSEANACLTAKVKNATLDNTYLVSFSMEKDFLPMWVCYGDSGRGIMLEFNRSKMEADVSDKTNSRFVECVYDSITKEKKCLEAIRDVKNSEDSEEDYIEWFACSCKNEKYCYEEEIRFCRKEDKDSPEICHRPGHDKLIRYLETEWPIDALKEIMVGPTLNSKSIVEDWLDLCDLKGEIPVSKSAAPFRL